MLIFDLQYDEKSDEYCQTINWSGEDLAFSVYGAGQSYKTLVGAKAEQTWEWVQGNLNSINLFASGGARLRHS